MTTYDNTTFFVTDIEADGPDPSVNSMLSFASVACSTDRGIIDSFYAVLEPRKDREQNAQTMTWWKTCPKAYEAATLNPRPPQAVMSEYADWVESHSGIRAFAADPLMFDGSWIDEYLKAFVSTRIMNGPFKWRKLFDGFGVDIPTFLGGLFGWPYDSWEDLSDVPPSWRNHQAHTHRAIDDATGYAYLLLKALQLSSERASHPQDFRRTPES